jgi:hypothetical protein
MANTGTSHQPPDELSIVELRQQLREAKIDRDGWQTQARLSNSHLQRILRSPAWRLTKPFRILNLIAWRVKPELHDSFDDPWVINKSGKSVWQMVRSQVKVEALNANLAAPKIAVLAHWSESEKISISVNKLIDELIENSYEVVLVSACDSIDELRFANNQQDKITILRKPNYGYDFGSWSVAFSNFPEILNAEEVLVLNDSNAGPFGSMKEMLHSMANSMYDITGVTDSLQIRYHIQSYMMHFKNKSLKHEAISSFWQEIYAQEEKKNVIQAYEIGLTSCAQGNGLYVGAIFPWNLIVDYWENPSIHGARRLIELGYPFVKREYIASMTEVSNETFIGLVESRFNMSAPDVRKMLLYPPK